MNFFQTITDLKAKNAIQFADYSHWQSRVNADKLKNNNIRGAIVKAGEVWVNANGQPAVKDDMHDWNMGELKRAGLLKGNYYFWHPKIGASRQYNHYWEISKNFQIDFPPVIDVEAFDGYNSSHKAEVSRQLLAMVEGIKKLFNRKPIIYCTAGAWVNIVGNPDWGKDLLFWIAQYNTKMMAPDPKIISNTIMWQYTDRLAIPGLVPLDGNFWLKDEKALSEVIRNNYTPPTSPDIPIPTATPVTPVARLKVTCSALLGRSQPIYANSTKAVYFKNGQILNIVQPMEIVANSGINFIKIQVPETGRILWVSNSRSYTKVL